MDGHGINSAKIVTDTIEAKSRMFCLKDCRSNDVIPHLGQDMIIRH